MLAEKWDVDLLCSSLVKELSVRHSSASRIFHLSTTTFNISKRFLFKLGQMHRLILDQTNSIRSDKLSTRYRAQFFRHPLKMSLPPPGRNLETAPIHSYSSNPPDPYIYIHPTHQTHTFIFIQPTRPIHSYSSNLPDPYIHIHPTHQTHTFVFIQPTRPIHSYSSNPPDPYIHIHPTHQTHTFIFIQPTRYIHSYSSNLPDPYIYIHITH